MVLDRSEVEKKSEKIGHEIITPKVQQYFDKFFFEQESLFFELKSQMDELRIMKKVLSLH